MRLLLVEDDATAAELLARGLRENAYAVDLAGDGPSALDRAMLYRYDLIILDVMLPESRRRGSHPHAYREGRRG